MGIQINGQTDTISALDNNFSLAGNVSIGGTLTYEDVTSVDAVGLSTFQAGIHIDDSIAHLGDTDTKIRFPANDTFTVETAGSERVRLTSAGLVGIGLTNPFGQLQVRAGTNANFSFSTGGGESSFEILNDAGSANVPLNVRASEYKIKIQGNEKVRITSAGLVGIGNTSPESYGSDGRNLVIGNSDSNAATGITLVSGTGGYSQLYFADGTSGSELYSGTIGYNHSENRMDFWTNGVRRLRINSTGNIGINSTDPTSYGNSQATLVIEDTTNPAICISDTGQTKDWWLVGFGDGLGVRYADGGGSGSASNVTSSMFFKNNGNLGVGNNNPQSKLQIENAGEQLRLTYPSVASYIHEVKSDGDYAIDKDGTERLRIDSTGRVHIGNDTGTGYYAQPVFQVHGYQNTPAGAGWMSINSGNDYPSINENVCLLSFANGANGEPARIECEAEAAHSGTSSPGRLVFLTTATGNNRAPAERMRISGGGKITAPGVYSGTTTGGGPVYVESDGDLLRYTSSLKYKTDVETIEDARADAILNVRPVWYRSKCENDVKTEGAEKSDWGWYGFIAEELAEIEPRLVNWATKDAVLNEEGSMRSVERDPADYTAEGVRYDNFVPLLVNLVQRQKTQIEALEKRLTDAGL